MPAPLIYIYVCVYDSCVCVVCELEKCDAEEFNVNMRLERDGVAHDTFGFILQYSLTHTRSCSSLQDRAPQTWGART